MDYNKGAAGVSAMTWIKVSDEKPPMNTLIMVLTGEFGFTPAIAIAKMWQSSLPDQPMKFYLDNDTYRIDGQCCIAEQVVAWQTIPIVPDEIELQTRMEMIEEIKPKVNPNKLCRPTKHTVNSLHRDYPHTTVNGKGAIARLKRKK